MLKVISLAAGPGAGKSTTAAILFNLMKRERYAVELVTEVAKDWTYEGYARLGDQLSVLAEQHWRLKRLEGKGVEWVITDSPLYLSLAYASPEDELWLQPIVDHLWDRFDNFNVHLERTKKVYQEFGRSQTLDEALQKDAIIRDLALEYGAYDWVDGSFDPDDPAVEYRILDAIKAELALP